MSDTETLGATLSPEEQSYFDSNGTTEIQTSEKTAGEGEGGAAQSANEADGKGTPKVEQMVSLAALHEERGKRKELGTKLSATERELAELKGKFSIIERLQVPKQEQEAPLTPEGDIFGYVKKLGETNEQLQKRIEEGEATRKEEGERNNLISSYKSDAAAFTAKNPDFGEAYNHLLQSRAQEMIALGYDDPASLQQALQNEEIQIARLAFQKGKSPAEIIYALAQQRGYKKADAKADGNDPAKKLETIARGQEANKSLSNTGGNSGDGDVTAEMLLKMSSEEFDAWCNKNPAKAKRIMGG